MHPLISVIVPVYNVQPYLRQCLDSLTGQTLHDIEIICVDDGSTDGSPDILAEYAGKDSRVRVITQANAGVCTARNAGMDAATAPYLMFCDSDDRYLPAMCAKMHTAIEESESDFVICFHECTWDDASSGQERNSRGKLHRKRAELYGKILNPSEYVRRIEDFDVISGWVVWNKIYRRSFLEKYDIRFPDGLMIDDLYFNSCCLALAARAYYLPEKLYYYRKREGSWMAKTLQKKNPLVIDYLRIALRLHDFFDRHGLFPQKTELWATLFCYSYDLAYSHAVSDADRMRTKETAAAYVREHFNLQEISTRPQLCMRKIFRLGSGIADVNVTKRFPLTVVNTAATVRMYCFGIPIWRIDYRNPCTRYYLFGVIRLYKRIL